MSISNKGSEELLSVNNLKTQFFTSQGTLKAVDGVSFRIRKGETVGIIGETGSGKTTIAFSILRLIPHIIETRSGVRSVPLLQRTGTKIFKLPPKVASTGEIIDGEVWFKGKDIMRLSEEELHNIRGREISIVFQNPISSMHPLMTIGYQVGEPKEAHEKYEWSKIRKIVFEYLGKVQIADVKKRYYHDPHMFSVGEGQRIMIAMALMCNPSLLIADEPTSSLDVLVQRQVLELLKRMKKEFGLSMLLMTHDLGVMAEMSNYVGVMYAGRFLEYGDVFAIFKDPKHPYTKELLANVPRIDKRSKLKGMLGHPPNPYDLPKGCEYHPRCSYSDQSCNKQRPSLVEIAPEHFVACSKSCII
jgi:peptide/nickel transport system ATP-binding protein/oligopeptide transport system ATP-binding protein